MAKILQKRAPRWVGFSFIGCVMVIFLLHCIEFFMVRLMDISIVYGLAMVFDESLGNFIEMLYASQIPLITWLWISMGSAAAVLGGIYLYFRSDLWSERRPLQFRKRYVVAFGATALLLMVNPKEGNQEFSQALPWKRTLFESALKAVKLEHSLKPAQNEEELLKRISRLSDCGKKNPDVFLFVIESLRADYITAQIAPNFDQFKQEFIAPELALASGNGTQLSWFSIFNSKYPFYFSQMNPKNWKSGSLGLQCLKALGYEVHVFSSSRLSYYQMDKRIFGENHQLANSFSLFTANEDIPAHESDRRCFAALEEKMEMGHGGRCFIVFLESTHFDYSFPEKGKFSPYYQSIPHAQLAFSMNGLEKVKNRYRNAIHYTDTLFGDFKKLLKNKGGWDEAVVIVTGDHGEEFYENGHLFHASNLSKEQIHVPLYFKFGKVKKGGYSLASHVDIFPSLLHYLLEDTTPFAGVFDGESLFSVNRWCYAITGRYNGCRDPYEFLIHDGDGSLLVRFNEKGKIFDANALEILKMDGKDICDFAPAIERLIERR
ncbi:MAG: sulfatase-like hydrolase/transferase [Verrucomicrobia bacterium]|nr:sulfatase-like hydrolase/transferase [Verrucomicrobiota bacterium]